MIRYKDGDINRGGFRYLDNGLFPEMLCIDICEENIPLDIYLNDVIKYINENSVKRIYINSSLSEIIDISFLYKMSTIEVLKISAYCKDLDPIYVLKPKALHMQRQRLALNFEKLKDSIENLDLYDLNPNFTDRAKIDITLLSCKKLKKFGLSNFDRTEGEVLMQMTWLEELEITNCKDKKFDLIAINGIKNLRILSMQQIPVVSLTKLSSLTNLEKLKLTQIGVKDLNGIEYLRKLENLTINYCTKLKDISRISACSKLKKIEFNTCKKIENFDCLSTLKKVQGLVISNCGNIPSLNFIKYMLGLKFLSFVDTNIVDGDLTECFKLQCVGTNDKRHYNVLSKNLPKNHDYTFWKL